MIKRRGEKWNIFIAFCHVSIFMMIKSTIYLSNTEKRKKGCVENHKNAWRKLSEVQW